MQDDDVTTRVVGKWPQILATLGVEPQYLTGKNGPCPFCGGEDRFAFTDYENKGIYLCRGCGNGDGWGFVRKYFNVNFARAVEMVEPLVGLGQLQEVEKKPKKDPIPALRYVAKQSKPVQFGGSVQRYLTSRGFEEIPEGLREAKLDFYQEGKSLGKFDTLVSLIQDFEGNGVSYHLTYTQNGKKADVNPSRKVMSPKGTITGAAIRLDVDFEDTICVAEGIESAYAAREDSGFPAFATITAHGMENFVPPNNVKNVWIYADNDKSFTGQAAAYALAKRLTVKGIWAVVIVPEKIGEDFNDQLMRKRSREESGRDESFYI